MLADVIRDRLKAMEFRPFTLVLATGERVRIRQPDSAAMPSVIAGGRRHFSRYIDVVDIVAGDVVTRSIAVPLVVELVDDPVPPEPGG